MIDCRINGEIYKLHHPFTIREAAGNNISSTIRISVPLGQRIPVAGDLVELIEDGQTLFLGTAGIPTSPKFTSEHAARDYTIIAGNGNSLLRRRNVNYAAQKKTITQIVTDLYSRYIMTEGISLGTISEVPLALDAYTAADINLQDVLNELADYISGAWIVTNERVFHFIAKENFDAYPTTITADTFIGAEIQTQTKDQDVRTAQTVKGLQAVTDTQIEDLIFDGVENEFQVNFPLVQRPTQILRKDGEVLAPERIGVKGIDDSQEDLVFSFAYNSRELTYRTSSGWLRAGQGFTVSYIGQFPIRVHSYNTDKIAELSAQTGTSGLIDNVHEDNTLTTIEDAQKLADNLIDNHGKERTEVQFWIRSSQLSAAGMTLDDLAVLNKFTFEMPEAGLVGDFVIVERTLETLSAAGSWADSLKIIIKMVDRSFVKSYGETLRVLVKQQMRNIREDVIVVSQSQISETLRLSETLGWSYGYPIFWPVPTTATDNDPLTGLDIYPY